MNTLLLTGTIKPNNDGKQKSTVLSDDNFFNPEYRLKQYISTILYYITQSDFNNIVFCENSNYEIKNIQDIESIAKLFDKNFELLQFEGDKEKIKKYSYHYGEAQIFDFAYENSKLLKKTNDFFKSTGRYKINNINDLLKEYSKYEIFFYKGFGLNSTLCVNTAFFKITKKFYHQYLYKKQLNYYHENGENIFIPLEGVYYQLLKKTLFEKNIQIKSIPFFHFFNYKTIIIEKIKKHIGLLSYGIIGKMIDIILSSKKQHEKNT